MRPPLRRVARIAEVLSGLGLAAAVALPRLVPLERIRAHALSAAESSLHRRVDAGDVRLEIFSGLGAGVENLSVRNAAGWESPALFSARRVSLKLAFWPLLARRVEIEKVVVDTPTVSIERNERGESNVDDLATQAPTVPAAEPGGLAEAAARSLRPESFRVSAVDVRRGRMVFIDRLGQEGRALRLAVDDISGSVKDIGSSAPTRFDVAARFLADAGRNVSVRGFVSPPREGSFAGAPMSVRVAATGLDLSRMAPYVPPSAGVSSRDAAGNLDFEATAEGAVLGALTVAGRAALAPSRGSRLPPVDAEYAVTLDWPAESLVIHRATVRAASLPLAAEGRVDGLRSAPRVDLRLATPESVPLEGIAALASAAGGIPKSVRLSGRLRFEARVRGPASDVAARIQADASSLGASVDGRPVIAAGALHAALASRGDRSADGRVTVPSGALRGIPFEDLAADWRWRDGTLVVAPVLRVLGGRIGMRMEANLTRPDAESSFAFEVAGLPAERLADLSQSPLRGALGGTIGGWMSMRGRGLGTEAFARTATGEGRIRISQAEFRTVRLLPEVVRTVARVGRAAGFVVPDGLDTPRRFALETGIRFGDGRVETPDLTLTSGDVAVRAGGSVSRDRVLSYRGRVVLGPEAVASFGRIGAYLADPSGRFEIPFHVSGPATAPQVSVDLDPFALGRRMVHGKIRDALPDRARRIVDGLLQGLDGAGFHPLERLRGLFARGGN